MITKIVLRKIMPGLLSVKMTRMNPQFSSSKSKKQKCQKQLVRKK